MTLVPSSSGEIDLIEDLGHSERQLKLEAHTKTIKQSRNPTRQESYQGEQLPSSQLQKN
jgi:hypothetical protein